MTKYNIVISIIFLSVDGQLRQEPMWEHIVYYDGIFDRGMKPDFLANISLLRYKYRIFQRKLTVTYNL